MKFKWEYLTTVKHYITNLTRNKHRNLNRIFTWKQPRTFLDKISYHERQSNSFESVHVRNSIGFRCGSPDSDLMLPPTFDNKKESTPRTTCVRLAAILCGKAAAVIHTEATTMTRNNTTRSWDKRPGARTLVLSASPGFWRRFSSRRS